MVYLTFFNTYASGALDVLGSAKNSYTISKWYDILHVSDDPRHLIQENNIYPASSITLQYTGRKKELHPYMYLLIAEPGKEILGAEPVKGLYSHIITSKKNILEEVKYIKGIKGFLDLKLDTEDSIQLPKIKNKNLFQAINASLDEIPDDDDCEEYLAGCYELSKVIDQYDPSLIISPTIHGFPIATASLWCTQSPVAYRTFFPVGDNYIDTSSYNVHDEIIEIIDKASKKELRSICYINGIVDGEQFLEIQKLIKGQCRENVINEKSKLMSLGLVSNYGDTLQENVKRSLYTKIRNNQLYVEEIEKLYTSFLNPFVFAESNNKLNMNRYSYHMFPCTDSQRHTYNRTDLLANMYIKRKKSM